MGKFEKWREGVTETLTLFFPAKIAKVGKSEWLDKCKEGCSIKRFSLYQYGGEIMTERMLKLGRIARKAVYYLLKYTFMAILLVRSLVYGVLSWLMPDTRVDRFVKASGKALVDGVSMINYAPLDDSPLGSDDDAYPRAAERYNYDYK